MDRRHVENPGLYTPDPASEFLGTIQAAGVEHEKEFLTSLCSEPGGVLDLTDSLDSEPTVRAIKDGHPVLYQARLQKGDFSGIADFLVRVPGESALGDYHYEVWDTKLAREAKPDYLIQLCCYADILEALQGVRPKEIAVVDRAKRIQRFSTDQFFYYYLELKKAFLEFHQQFDSENPPFITGNEDFGRWDSCVREMLESQDALSRVSITAAMPLRRSCTRQRLSSIRFMIGAPRS